MCTSPIDLDRVDVFSYAHRSSPILHLLVLFKIVRESVAAIEGHNEPRDASVASESLLPALPDVGTIWSREFVSVHERCPNMRGRVLQ